MTRRQLIDVAARTAEGLSSAITGFLAIPRDGRLLRCAGGLFVVWLACTGPVRWLGRAALPGWLMGSAPNFFAGLTLTVWQAYVVPGRAAGSATVAFAVLAAVEGVQTLMPQHRADPIDLLASALGCGLAALVLGRDRAPSGVR